MAEHARTVLSCGRSADLDAVWTAVDAFLAKNRHDRAVWRAADEDGRVEILADVFYRCPAQIAVPAAAVVGYPPFLHKLLDRMVGFLSESGKRWFFKELIHSQLCSRDRIRELLPEDLKTAIEPLLITAKAAKRTRLPIGTPEQRKPALTLLLARPALVRRLAAQLQMAVPFAMALAKELDEIDASRTCRAAFDPRAVIAGLEQHILAEEARLHTPGAPPVRLNDLRNGCAELVDLADRIDDGDPDARKQFCIRARSLVFDPKAPAPPDAACSERADATSSPQAKREERYGPRRALDMGLVGVAFSGGGIRSATLNLGVLQALAARNVLPHVDYLSTVSGGGYIGSWLCAWTKRQAAGITAVQRFLTRTRTPDPDAPDARPIRFLREFSNYLTPRLGLLGADTWSMVSTLTRNTILNQIVLVTFLAAVLLAPRAIAGAARLPAPGLIGVSLALFFFACVSIGKNLALLIPEGGGLIGGTPDSGARVQKTIVAPLFLSAVTLACAVTDHPPAFTPTSIGIANWLTPAVSVVGGVLAGMSAWPSSIVAVGRWLAPFGAFWIAFAVLFSGLLAVQVTGGFGRCFALQRPRWINAVAIVITSALSASVGAAVVKLCSTLALQLSTLERLSAAIVFGPPLLVIAFSAAGVAQVGLLGMNFPDERREWVSRLGAWLLIYATLWTAVFAGAIYGPLWVLSLGMKLSMLSGAGWIASTIAGLRAGSRSKSPMLPGGWRDTLASAAMYIFIVGLVLMISLGIYLGLIALTGVEQVEWSIAFLQDPNHYWLYVSYDARDMLLLTLGAFAAAFAFAWRIDVNEFSMHHFYRNRLVRCFLGASRALVRMQNPFTGFDPKDDLKLTELRVDVPPAVQKARGSTPTYIGPYPLINTTLNLVKGDNLAWQERKAASFVLTPWYCGFELPPAQCREPNPQVVDEAFRPTLQFAYANDWGISLGTAAAISGAAASPNQGYQSSPAAAFLMTMFNARLGWWIGNPRSEWKWRRASPRVGLLYLLAELTGSTNDRSSFVNLSDGGHFENLGLYELIRRRCRYILAFDAEQDGDLTFGALGGAVRKCRVDFGVDIDIDVRAIRRVARTKRSTLHYAAGTIAYPNGETGTLVYFKSSLTGDEPADVQQYATAHPEFPHQSTADQWFSESQFESYRALGEHMVEVLCAGCATRPFLIDRSDVPSWFDGLRHQIGQSEAAPETSRRVSASFGGSAAAAVALT